MKNAVLLPSRSVFRAAVLLLILCGLLPVARAQFDAAVILGTIRDAQGAVVPGATVTLTNLDLGTHISRIADGQGNFEFPSVPIGAYRVDAAHDGFAPAQSSRFDLTISARQRVDLTLSVGRAEASVTVEASASQLETDTSAQDTVINHDQIVDLPLNGRSYADLATLVPGVHLSSIEDGTINSREAAYNVHGQRSTANNFLLDGLDNNAYQTENQGFSSQTIHPSPDALNQFKVETANFSAEFGRVGGAVINATTRGGSNGFHGTVWEYLRNTVLNAYGPFYGTGVKPSLVQNQFGASFGGPIRRNRSFFFVDYEGFRNSSHTYTTVTLPTAQQRMGIFTNDKNEAVPVKVSFTGTTYKTGILPQTVQTPFALAVLQALPPNTAPGFSNNFSYLPASTNQNDKGDVRIDQYFGSRLVAFARLSEQSALLFAAPDIPGPAGGNSSGNIYMRNAQVASGATYTLNANSLFDARIAFTWTQSGKSPVNVGQPSLLVQYGIPGLPTDPSIAGSLNVQAVSDFAAFGRQSSNPALVDPYTINPKFSYTRQHGAHTLKFGYEYVALSMGLADEYPLYGDDTYSGKYSAAGGADQSTAALTTEANEAWYLADFLQGLRSKYQLSGNQVFNYQQRFHYFYGQDDWKVNDRLTLNLGLRYELVTPPWVDGNQLANFSPTTNTLINASSGSLYNRSLIDIQSGNLAPRFGFAYSANRFVVLRGGYGISYVQGNRNGAEGTLAYNTVPNNVISQTTPSATNPACPAGSNSTACFRTTMEGYPSNFLTTQLNTATSIAEIRYVPKDDPTGYVQSYQLGFQAAITSNTLLDTAYVGSHGVHLRVLTDYNQAVANPGGSSTACPAPATGATPCATLSSRRPIQSFDSIIEPLGAGFLNYDSLEVKLQHRSHFGIYLLNSFTWSKAYDDAGAQYEVNNGDGALVNKYDMASERGVSGYNQPFNNTTSFVWDLPRLRVSGLWSARPSKLLLDGWQLVGINIVTSGVPVNLTYSPSSSQEVTDASVSYSYRPNIVGNVSAVINPRSQWVRSSTAISNVYSSSNLSTPTATPFGNVQRNALIGPAYGNFDFGAHKNFALWWEGSSLQFRVEAFNLFNATNYKSPDGNISSTSFGSFTSTGVFPSRRMQFALRLAF